MKCLSSLCREVDVSMQILPGLGSGTFEGRRFAMKCVEPRIEMSACLLGGVKE